MLTRLNQDIVFFAEFDALTGCKLSSIDIGATVVRMAYSPAGGHVIVAVLEVRWSSMIVLFMVYK